MLCLKRFVSTSVVLLALVWTLPLWAQSTGELRGKVVDSAGHAIVSAFVIVTAEDTSVMRAATTDESGEFEFASLPVGTYHVEVSADQYPRYSSHGVRASIGQVIKLEIVLGAKESRAATGAPASAAMVESGNAQLGVVMNSLAVTKLPLKSRDTFELLQLQPGVQSALGADLFFEGDRPGVVSVNGGRARSNNYNVNGGTSGDQMVNFPSIQPSPDSVDEFRIISHNYDAALGSNSGSVLNVVTRSGNPSFHGSGYEFLRNDSLNSKGYFDPQTPEFRQNEFGGTFGGPIRRDRTFFFSSFEGRRLRRGIASESVIVPTQAERAGNFSSGPAFSGTLQDAAVAQALAARPGCAAAVQVQGGAAMAAGTAYSSIFPGNVIPTECFDATAADLMNQFVPAALPGGNAFRSVSMASADSNQATLRIDQNLTVQQHLSAYYYFADGFDLEPFSRFLDSGANLPGFGNQTRERFQQFNLSHSWTINARTTNELRAVYYRDAQGKLIAPAHTNLLQQSCATVPAAECFTDPSNPRLGITPGYGAALEGVPFVAISGGFSFGNNPNGSFSQSGNVYQLSDTYSKVAGSHTLKFGAHWRNQRLNQLYFYDVNGSFQFTGGGPNDLGFSDLLPNYLLGLPDSYSQGSANSVDARSTQFHVFAQDAWKARSNLTLDYGLRWELNTPQFDAAKRIQGFRPGQATAIYPCALSVADPLVSTFNSNDCSPNGPARSVFPLGLVVPGDRGVPQGITNTYWKSFAPRVGLAWAPNVAKGWLHGLFGDQGTTSVRAGWGMFYDSNEEMILGENFTASPPFGGSTALSNVFFNTPFRGQDGSVIPNPYSGFLDPKPGSPVDFALFRPITLYGNFPSTMRSQYSVHYHLTLQRQLARDTLLQFGYVGSQGHRLLASIDQNYGNAQTCLDLNQVPGMSCGPFGADGAYTIPAGAIPAGVTVHLPYGSVPSVTGPNANPITLVGLRKYSSPFCQPTTGAGCPPDGVPVFGSIFATEPIANSDYNSFQLLLNRRLARGLQFLGSYTWSKFLDNASSFENEINPLDPGRSRSLSLYDTRHRLVLSGFLQVPEMHSKNWSRHIVNGWSLSSIVTVQSGFPLRITSQNDRELMNSFDYEMPGEPDQVAPLQILDPRKFAGYYFAPSSFTDSPLGQIGNARRTICCGPGIANIDFAVHKNIEVAEGKRLEFRAEFFNFLNHTQFFNPDGNFSDGTSFGQVQRARDPRLIQLALRFTF